MMYLKIAVSYVLVAVVLFFNTLDARLLSNPPEPKTEAELAKLSYEFDEFSLSEEIFVIRSSNLSAAEKQAVIALQGLVAKSKPAIFIDYGNATCEFSINELEKAGHIIVRCDETGKEWKFESLVSRFKSYIKDSGYILYSTVSDHGQLNTATNLATLNGWLPVSAEIEEKTASLGLVRKADISGDDIDIAYQRKFYEKYKDSFRKDSLVHLYYYADGMRDFAVQQNIFVMYVDDSDYEGRLYRNKVLKELDAPAIIFGWCQYEVKFTECISGYGHYVVPSDHSFNLSILSSFDSTDEKIGRGSAETVELDPDKHYIAIVFSDGDNAQWIQNGFKEFHTWQSYNSDVPVTWTFPPIVNEISDVDVKRTLGELKNGSFITGPTGAGYGRITKMDSEELEKFSNLTASVMLENGLTTMTVLDELPNDGMNRVFQNKLGYFARYDNIHGGILQLDPDRYSAGGGRVFFVNDKPFVSVGLSLWHPSGDANQVTKEWLAEQAAIINAKPADITTINGYTVINVHPWTVGPDDVAYFVSQLDADVEVITADEMISALGRNIPHNYAEPN